MTKPVAQPLEGSIRVTPSDDVVYTMGTHCAEYLAELIEADCARNPAEQAWKDAASLRAAVDIINARYAPEPSSPKPESPR